MLLISFIFYILSAIITIFIAWIKSRYRFWEMKGLQTPPKPKFLFGNCWQTFSQKITFAELTHNIYKYFKSKNMNHGGIYYLITPMYFPVGIEEIKNVLQTDFDHFTDRGVRFSTVDEVLNENIFVMKGLRWKNVRAKLTPTFTSGKLKIMFVILLKCTEQLNIEVNKFAENQQPIEMKDILSRFTTDIIGNCAFGIDCNSLKDPKSEFRKYGMAFFKDSVIQHVLNALLFALPILEPYVKFVAIKRDVSEFFKNLVKGVVNYREIRNVYRRDFLQLLINLKNSGQIFNKGNYDETPFSINDICAESFVFFIAGFETSSTTMTFCFYELAANQEIQEKLRQEVLEVIERNENTLTYDCLSQMTYLDQVVNETLRKYPPLPTLNRICTKDYQILDTNILIERGTKVIIPVIGIHYDEEFYPNPNKFDPERFSTENKNSRPDYTFLPFGEGPRICIGLRFGLIQTKLGIITMLRNFKFTLNSKTTLPLKMDPKSFIVSTKSGMWLNVSKIE